jgi:hypothetical protein
MSGARVVFSSVLDFRTRGNTNARSLKALGFGRTTERQSTSVPFVCRLLNTVALIRSEHFFIQLRNRLLGTLLVIAAPPLFFRKDFAETATHTPGPAAALLAGSGHRSRFWTHGSRWRRPHHSHLALLPLGDRKARGGDFRRLHPAEFHSRSRRAFQRHAQPSARGCPCSLCPRSPVVPLVLTWEVFIFQTLSSIGFWAQSCCSQG